MTTIFVTGASGYIGGTVALRLVAAGMRVRGLVRRAESAAFLSEHGVEPVAGSLDDLALLAREARNADGVIDAASADHASSVEAFINALRGTNKPLLHTSGSSVVGDDARGDSASDLIVDDSTPFPVAPAKQHRRDIDLMVMNAASEGVRGVVICPGLVYGAGLGENTHSVQIPFLVDNAIRHGAVQIVGKGLNRWSNVHIADLAELYLLALNAAPAGSFYFAENGEASFAELGAAISAALGLGPLESLAADLAATQWGEARAYYTFGSNSRVRAARARRELGWTPTHSSVVSWITNEIPSQTA